MASPAERASRIRHRIGDSAFPGYLDTEEKRAAQAAAADEARRATEAQVPQQPNIHRHTMQPHSWALGATFRRK
jgi:hypothetical protein